ncbi:acyl-CoA dehydrogenase [Cubamyces menziesii]|nr:acyl-CoA dehydrogenase [Cubamyces menziesii]
MAAKEMKRFTREEVAKRTVSVFDVTRFRNLHPGGASVFMDEGIPGQDATEAFFGLHRYEVLEKPQYARLQIGVIEGEEPQIQGGIIRGAVSKVPYAEPTWLSEGFKSPYYKESHRRLQQAVRKFVDEVVYPDAQDRELDGKRPSQSVLDKMAELNLHAMRMGPGKHLKGLTLMGGIVSPEEFDYFHEGSHQLVISQEIARCGARGYGDGLMSGCVIGLPPVLNFGSPELKARIVPEILSGKKFICLAVSEAYAGSDVFGLQTTATKTEDGKHWIITGTKKWITNGTFADYFTVGCKTEDGFTVILVERGEGVSTKPIKTSYSSSAGTAYVTFDHVKVPVENTLGEEGGGIFVMLSNFNHERWVNQRKAFGRPLHSLAVIRSKLAGMISRVESLQSWLESVTYQMCNMSYREQASKLAGQIAFLKSHMTRSAQLTAADAVQIFGGRGITQTGMGKFIEHYHRTVTFDALLGGGWTSADSVLGRAAEDVLADLGVRQAIRGMPSDVRL